MAGSEVESTVPSMFSMNKAVAMMKAVRTAGRIAGLVGRSPCGAARGSRQAHDRSGRRDAAHKRVIGPRGATERSTAAPCSCRAVHGFDAAAHRYPTSTIRVASEWRNVGADFSSASSDFRALGAFSVLQSLLQPSRGSSAGVAHGQPCARVPDIVGSTPPRPYHFRARIQSFQAVAAPFPGDSVLPSGSLSIPATETLRFKRPTIGSSTSTETAVQEQT